MYMEMIILEPYTYTQAHTRIHSMDTSIHTKRFDKCLTPRVFPSHWGQAFVEPFGVCEYVCVYTVYMEMIKLASYRYRTCGRGMPAYTPSSIC